MSSTNVSFKFSKISRKRLVQDGSAILQNAEDKTEENHVLIKSLDRQGFRAVNESTTSEKQEIIIPPLPNADRFTLLNRRTTETRTVVLHVDSNDADAEAKRALIEEAFLLNGAASNGVTTTNNEVTISVTSDDERIDVSALPDEPSDADYEEISVDTFGKALLRGMGWKEGAGIGRSSKIVAPPTVSAPRPKGLGLGAEIKPPSSPPKSSKKDQSKEKKEEQKEISIIKTTKTVTETRVLTVEDSKEFGEKTRENDRERSRDRDRHRNDREKRRHDEDGGRRREDRRRYEDDRERDPDRHSRKRHH